MSQPNLRCLTWENLHIFPLPAVLDFEVEQHHIDHGIRGSCTDCAVSLAACKYLGLPVLGMLVSSRSGIVLYSKFSYDDFSHSKRLAHWMDYYTPSNYTLENFIERFDAHQTLEPIRITLPLVRKDFN